MKTLYPRAPRNPHSIHRADSFRKLILFLLFVALAIIASANPFAGKVEATQLKLKERELTKESLKNPALGIFIAKVTGKETGIQTDLNQK